MYIGIDLGTSNSAIAGIVDGDAHIFRPTDGGEVLPSVIYVDKRGRRLYGRRAYDQALISPENVAAGFKRLMGTSTPLTIKGADLTLTPEECSAEILAQLLGQASTETGLDDFTGAIITVPAAFNQMQCEATLRAARLAGLERVDLLQEPVAAALASIAGTKRSGQFLIYDLGGGTFDVALAQSLNGEVSIVAQQGINMLGGRDFDRMIVNEIVRPWLLANFDLPENFQRDPQYSRLIRVAQLAAERAKIDLSTLDEASIFASDDDIRLLDQSENEIFLDAPITRTEFEDLIREPILQTVKMVHTILEENNYTNEDIDRIVFVGGPSRIPLVRQLVSEQLGIAVDLKTDPMTAVAVGAAYYAESRVWDLPEEPEAEMPQAASAPKEREGTTSSLEEPCLSFNYPLRTPEDKAVITVHDGGAVPMMFQMRVTTEGWDSGLLPVVDNLTVLVPLRVRGENRFDIRILDENNQHLSRHDESIVITRVTAIVGSIRASQTIAVKALQEARSRENVLLPLLTKGQDLPAQGHAKFLSGRDLEGGSSSSISFELFQVEYPERIDLNLCVGLFQITGRDLPEGIAIRAGDEVVFDWSMSDGGILRATVHLPASGTEIKVPRFYAPQGGQMSFDEGNGAAFARAVLARGDEEWGDLAAALGPQGGPEIQLLQTRLTEQRDMLEESIDDAELIRRVVEETRFIRQDIARLSKRHGGVMLQRRLGKMNAVFNRVARAQGKPDEIAYFTAQSEDVQEMIDAENPSLYEAASQKLSEMRALFFSLAWRDPNYVTTWFRRLAHEPYLFPDHEEFESMCHEGEALLQAKNASGLKDLVGRMLDARIALGASDIASEPATLVRS